MGHHSSVSYMRCKLAGMGRRTREKLGPYIPKVFIRELRKERDLSMVALLDRVAEHGVVLTEGSLSRIERSKQPADTPTLHAIAKALGVTITEVMTGVRLNDDQRKLERLSPRDREVASRMMEGMLANAESETAGTQPAGAKPSRRPAKG